MRTAVGSKDDIKDDVPERSNLEAKVEEQICWSASTVFLDR
jgi:hypothetical protein